MMPFWIYILISRILHINDSTLEADDRGEDSYDPWAKVRLLLDAFNNASKHHYTPSHNVSIDENLIGKI